ncbi:MAG: aspartyl/asparaginyl beta-hydroxylase domain-containing protein [Colwellia sp.]|nr:aspartyl/asparaginyl beta-hydroxylase domain-containing protein [Colwellia sp.]
MYIKQKFIKISHVDVTQLQEEVNKLTTSQWAENSLRQKMFEVHNNTQTIPLVFDPDLRHHFQTVQATYALFEQSLLPILSVVKAHFLANTPVIRGDRPNSVEKGYFVRIILVKLAAHGKILPHQDHGYSLSRAHRIHLPIITNDKVKFTIDGMSKVLAEGELMEINNRGTHAVINESNQERIHLIFDFVIPDEIINDPISGTLYA